MCQRSCNELNQTYRVLIATMTLVFFIKIMHSLSLKLCATFVTQFMQPSKTLPATEVCLQGGAVTLTESLYNPHASYAPSAPSIQPSQLRAPLRAPRPGPPTPRPAAPPRKAAPPPSHPPPPTSTNTFARGRESRADMHARRHSKAPPRRTGAGGPAGPPQGPASLNQPYALKSPDPSAARACSHRPCASSMGGGDPPGLRRARVRTDPRDAPRKAIPASRRRPASRRLGCNLTGVKTDRRQDSLDRSSRRQPGSRRLGQDCLDAGQVATELQPRRSRQVGGTRCQDGQVAATTRRAAPGPAKRRLGGPRRRVE